MAAVALAATLLAGAQADPPGTEAVVAFTRTRFEPATVEVRRGARVTFHNMDSGGQRLTVAASDGSFETPPLGPGGEWTHRFEAAGEHAYFLKERPETRGRALVDLPAR